MSAPPRKPRVRPGVGSAILFAVAALLLFIAAAFAAGFAIGKLLV